MILDKVEFYKLYKNFDWKFYTSIYTDLTKAGIFTEADAMAHYHKFGKNENRRICEIVKNNITEYVNIDNLIENFNQVSVSSGLHMFKKRFLKKYNLQEYNDDDKNAIFFGIYTNDDLLQITKNKGLKLVIWGGEDCNIKNIFSYQTITEIKKIPNIIHISISECIKNSLDKMNLNSLLIEFNLVDKILFKQLPYNKRGHSIYIYNGNRKGREHVYGSKIYNEVIKSCKQFKYIFSTDINISYEEMVESVYSKCFIVLRLTSHDGNANTAQECESLDLPIIHNFSKNGLKWNNYFDVIYHIKNEYKKYLQFNLNYNIINTSA